MPILCYDLEKFIGKWKGMPSGISSCRRHENANIFVGPFIFRRNKEAIFCEKCRYFIRTWQHSSVNEEIILKKMPIVSSGILSCRYHKNADILSDPSVCRQIKKTFFYEKCRYFIKTWESSSQNEEIILKKMPIVSSGIIFCRHYEIADIFVGPFIF